jgi:SAM-dependent methyltransferase
VFATRRPSDSELEEHYMHYGTAWHDSSITRLRYRELLDAFEPYRQSNRILDFGCGAGFFLEEAQARGWDAVGSEFSERALQLLEAKGLQVLRAPLSADSLDAESFDVITAFEVLEHVREPLDEARIMARGLRAGGLFYCTTPNWNAVNRRLLGPEWSVIGYPEHLSYFTVSSLSACLVRAGFERRRVATTGFAPGALVRKLPAADAPPAGSGSVDERLRSASEGSLLLRGAKTATNAILSAIRGGDTLKGWFERR